MSRVQRTARAARPDADVVSGRRLSRGRVTLVSTLAAALLAGGGMALVGGASAQPSGQPEGGRPETETVGRNWHSDRQDAQPNYQAREPAERGQRLTPEQRLEQVRPSGGTGAPERASSGEAFVPVTEEPAK